MIQLFNSKKNYTLFQLEAILKNMNIPPTQVLPEEAYRRDNEVRHQWIENCQIKFEPTDDYLKVNLQIRGDYCQAWACGYWSRQDSVWHPGPASKESFQYEKTITGQR